MYQCLSGLYIAVFNKCSKEQEKTEKKVKEDNMDM